MQINVLDRLESVMHRGDPACIEYRIRFKTAMIEGLAKLITNVRETDDGIAGMRFIVETGYDRVDQFKPVENECEECVFSTPGSQDYAIVGEILHAWQDRVVIVRSRDIDIMIEIPSDYRNDITPGIKIAFDLHGLTFWDISI
jgi:hypothetical protein